MHSATTRAVYVPPGKGLLTPYTASLSVLNHVDPARVRPKFVVLPTTVLADS